METKRITENIEDAAQIIYAGGLVAVPTETVYGLAGNGLDEQAVKEIYEVKGRPPVKALSLMVPGPEAIKRYAREVPPAARTLAERFWPGPLTLILPSRPEVPEIVRAGGDTIGLRCPDHPLTLEALRLARLPFAAPSANPSGEPSPRTAQEVLAYFDGKIPAVIDGGPCGLGRESTILDLSRSPYRVLRQGALPEEEIDRALVEGMTLVGVTGGTGCGKTTALEAFRRHGALVIDCDEVYHELLERDEKLLRELKERFPAAFSEGRLDRKALGRIVFADSEALEALNTMTHSAVGREVEARLTAWAREGGRLAAVDAVELISSGMAGRCRATIGVLAPENMRLERIMARDGISRDYALSRIRAGRPDDYYRANCSHILHNNGGLNAFADQCEELIKENLSTWMR